MLYKNFGDLRNILLATSIETMSFHSCSLALCKSCVLVSKPIPSVWATTRTVCKAILNPYSCLQLPLIQFSVDGLSCFVKRFNYTWVQEHNHGALLLCCQHQFIPTTGGHKCPVSQWAPWNYNCTLSSHVSQKAPAQFTTHGCVGFCSGEWNALGHLKARSLLHTKMQHTA